MSSKQSTHRHRFTLHGKRVSPVCVSCGAPNPKPLTDEEWAALADESFEQPQLVEAIRRHEVEVAAGPPDADDEP